MLHIESPGFLQLVSWLPDDMLLNHVLNALTVSDRSSLRATCKRAQGLANLAVKVRPDMFDWKCVPSLMRWHQVVLEVRRMHTH